MKTIKLTRTIRREVDGAFVYIGPKGIGFRDKHRPKRETFELTWKQIYVQAHLLACAEEEKNLQPLVKVNPIPEDGNQMPMFPELAKEPVIVSDLHTGDFVHTPIFDNVEKIVAAIKNRDAFDEGVNCEDVPGCDMEYPQSPEPADRECYGLDMVPETEEDESITS